MAEVKTIELQINTNIPDASKKIDGLKSSVEGAKTSVKGFKNETEKISSSGFDKLSGSLSNVSPKLNTAISGAKAFGAQLLLLAANPVGATIIAVVGAVTLLYKAFTSTKAGGEALERVMAGIGATVDVLRDRILNVGNAIVNFFSGNFKGALSEAKKSVSGIGSEIEKEFKQAAEAKRYLQEVDDALRSLGVSRAKLNRDLAKSKEIITDENASYAEKKKAIEEVRIAEEKQTQAELINAAKKLKAIKLANSLSDTGKEDLQKEATAQAELYALQEKSATDRRAIRKTEIRADKEEQARLKAIATERNEIAKSQKEAEKTALKDRQDRAKLSFENEKSLVDEQLKNTKISIDEKRNIVLNDEKLSKADREKFLIDLHNQEIAQEEAHNKSIADLNKRYDDEKLNRLADTAVKKEELDYQRQVSDIEKIAQTELERQTLIEKLDVEHKARMGVARKTDSDKEIAESKAKEDKITADKKAAEDARRNINSIAIQSAQGLVSILAGLGEKNKKLQKAALIANGALSIAEIINNTNVGSAKEVATKGIFGLSTSAVLYAKMAISIGSVIAATTKGLSALGGGASLSATPAGGGGGVAAAPPSFNVVGASATNQLAQTIGQKEQQPVKAYVVSNDVTTAQSLNRNIISSATLG